MTTDAGPIPSDVVDEAIGWMVARREGLTDEEHVALGEWLENDPRHRLAWSRLERSLDPCRVVQDNHVRGERLIGALRERRVTRRTLLGNGVAGLAVAALTLESVDRVRPIGGLFADYSTGTGERRRYTLPDGSGLTLDARSRADLDFGAGHRGLELRAGTAFVDVRSHDMPFVASCDGVPASILHGSLVLNRRGGEMKLVCLDGIADVSMGGNPAARLRAGMGVAVQEGKLLPLPAEQTHDAASWIDGRLILHEETLGAMIEAFRPYSSGIISVSAEAAKLPISGVFYLERLENALGLVQQGLPIRVMRVGNMLLRIDLPNKK